MSTVYLRRLVTTTKAGLLITLVSLFLFIAQPIQAQTQVSVSGLVFEDLNFNNNLDLYEARLSAWQVNLYQKDKLIKTELTNEAGEYEISGLVPGDYWLKVEIPKGFAPVNGQSSFISLKPGQDNKVNFANYQVIRKKDGVLGPLMYISNYSAKVISPTAVEISWFTTHLATSQVVFSQTPKADGELKIEDNNLGYQDSTVLDFTAKTYHSVTLSNLKPDTTYYFRLVALPDPKQWRGASKIFSPELSFTTPSLNNGGKILATEFTSNESQQLRVGEIESGLIPPVQNPTTTDQSLSTAEENNLSVIECPFYVIILLFLNLAVISIIYYLGRRTRNETAQRLWWLVLIFVVIPVILGYPECWLVIWLLTTGAVEIILLSGFKKKSPPPPSSTKDDDSISPFNPVDPGSDSLE